jgi:hypothetical protein
VDWESLLVEQCSVSSSLIGPRINPPAFSFNKLVAKPTALRTIAL